MRRSLLIVATLMLTVSSCATVEYITQPLDRPPSLTVEELPTEGELECLSDSSYSKVVRMHRRIMTLENIIDSTQ
jgi:hypothetical protein